MYATFDFNHTTTIDIPEFDLIEQTVTFDVEVGGELEDHFINSNPTTPCLTPCTTRPMTGLATECSSLRRAAL